MTLHIVGTTPATRARAGRLGGSPRRRSAEAVAFVALWTAAVRLRAIDSILSR